MPAAAAVVPLLAPAAPVRRVRAGRTCAVCGDRPCSDSAACAAEYTEHAWTECADCGGSGYDSTGFDIWCPVCRGARVVEVCR